MALSGNTVWENRSAGSDTNGGGFVAGASGTDYSQRDTKRSAGAGDTTDLSTTDGVANGTTTFTSATANFSTGIVGNIIYINGAWYQVTARASTTSITVDRTITAASGLTLNIGGALASLGQIGAIFTTGNSIHIANDGTYSITSASTNVPGGCFSAGSKIVSIYGYNTTRFDAPTGTNRPLLQASGISAFTLLAVGTATGSEVAWLRLDGASLAGGVGISSANHYLYNLDLTGFTGVGAVRCTDGIVERVIVHNCGTSAFGTSTSTAAYINCSAYSCAGNGFTGTIGSSARRCISANHTGTVEGFSNIAQLEECIAYNNGQHGCVGARATNCISVNNGTNGYNQCEGLWSCASYNNGGSRASSTGVYGDNNPIVLTGDPFTNAASNDFSLNNTAGAGAACRGAGYPGVLDFGGTGYLDVGVLQHQDSASSGGKGFSASFG